MVDKLDSTTNERLGSALTEYIEAVAEFEKASIRFNRACGAVRYIIRGVGPKQIVYEGEAMYLVTIDADGSFEVQPIEVV